MYIPLPGPKAVDNWGYPCPDVCPVKCDPSSNYCEHIEWTGCDVIDGCISDWQKDYSGEYCNAHCPAYCGPNDLFCPGCPDEKGCLSSDLCVSPGWHVGKDGKQCEAFCESCCSREETLCNGNIDWNECPIQGFLTVHLTSNEDTAGSR